MSDPIIEPLVRLKAVALRERSRFSGVEIEKELLGRIADELDDLLATAEAVADGPERTREGTLTLLDIRRLECELGHRNETGAQAYAAAIRLVGLMASPSPRVVEGGQ